MALTSISAVRQFADLLTRCQRLTTCPIVQRRSFHASAPRYDKFYDPEENITRMHKKRGWLDYNDVVYQPTKEGDPPRPAEICHQRDDIMISPKKFWYSAVLVRGLSIDEAIRQCEFSKKLAAKIIKEVLLEAQEMAVHDFNVEFQSNLWVADSFVENHYRLKTIKRHARGRMATTQHRFSTYFVRLREGQPPKHYYAPEPSGREKLEQYIKEQRARRIVHSL